MFEFERFSQIDPRWKNVQLGFEPSTTIGYAGCLLTCATMVATGFGFQETPETLNAKLKALGPSVGFFGAALAWGGIPKALPGVTFKGAVDCDNSPAPIERIDAALNAGFPVIVEVDYSTDPGLQYHWIILYGKKGNDYLLQDPYPYPPPAGEVLLTQSRYAHRGAPQNIITGAIWLEGPIKKPIGSTTPTAPIKTPTTPTVPSTPSGMKVYVTESDLALRAQDNTSAALIKRLPAQTELTVLDSESVARIKMGVNGQWLRVRDASGAEGYIAAWYVSASKPQPAPTPTGSAMLVRTTTPDVALRTQGVISDATLIKRLAFNAKLTVLDPEATAMPKIGVNGQWLRVRDMAGAEGYVAAWYVAVTT